MPPPVRRVDGDYHFHAYDYVGAVAFKPGPAQPNRADMRFYSMERDLGGLLQEGQNRGVPNITLTTVGLSPYGRNINALSFGNPNAPTVVFTGGIHAREWIGHEMAYLIAEYLIVNYTDPPQNRYAATIKGLVNSRNIHIIPMQNPDGNDYSVFGVGDTDGTTPRLWRKNRMPMPTTAAGWLQAIDPMAAVNPPPYNPPPFNNVQQEGAVVKYGVPDYEPNLANPVPPNPPLTYLRRTLPYGTTGVDLNRNFDTQGWGYDCVPNSAEPNWRPTSITYFGPRRNSETETQAIQLALGGQPPRIMVDYHSYGGYILYPSEAFYNGTVNANYVAAGLSLRALIRSVNNQYYQLGAPHQLIGYSATGSIMDYAEQHHATRAITIELDPLVPQGQLPTDPNGFVLPENMIRTVFERNIRGALATLAIPDTVSRTILVNDFLTWNVYGRGNRLPSA